MAAIEVLALASGHSIFLPSPENENVGVDTHMHMFAVSISYRHVS